MNGRYFCAFCGMPSAPDGTPPHGLRPCPDKALENTLRHRLLEAQIAAVTRGETTRVPWLTRDPDDL